MRRSMVLSLSLQFKYDVLPSLFRALQVTPRVRLPIFGAEPRMLRWFQVPAFHQEQEVPYALVRSSQLAYSWWHLVGIEVEGEAEHCS